MRRCKPIRPVLPQAHPQGRCGFSRCGSLETWCCRLRGEGPLVKHQPQGREKLQRPFGVPRLGAGPWALSSSLEGFAQKPHHLSGGGVSRGHVRRLPRGTGDPPARLPLGDRLRPARGADRADVGGDQRGLEARAPELGARLRRHQLHPGRRHKLHLLVAHVEAGLRSFNRRIPSWRPSGEATRGGGNRMSLLI